MPRKERPASPADLLSFVVVSLLRLIGSRKLGQVQGEAATAKPTRSAEQGVTPAFTLGSTSRRITRVRWS
jgi:hypothetical protein